MSHMGDMQAETYLNTETTSTAVNEVVPGTVLHTVSQSSTLLNCCNVSRHSSEGDTDQGSFQMAILMQSP